MFGVHQGGKLLIQTRTKTKQSSSRLDKELSPMVDIKHDRVYCYNMKKKKVFLPEVLNTVISLLTSSSVTLPLLMARRVSSRSAPVEINND